MSRLAFGKVIAYPKQSTPVCQVIDCGEKKCTNAYDTMLYDWFLMRFLPDHECALNCKELEINCGAIFKTEQVHFFGCD